MNGESLERLVQHLEECATRAEVAAQQAKETLERVKARTAAREARRPHWWSR